MDYVELARQKALKYGLNPDLFVRQIQAESSFNPNAVSPKGAIGLGQIMPATAKELGINPENPDENLDGAARYMRQQLDTFGDYPLALAAYNAGAGNVRKAGGIPNFTETQNYVSKIMGTGGSAMNANMGTGGLLAASQAVEEEYKQEQANKPLFQRDSFKDMAGDMAILFNSMRMEPDDNIVAAVNSIKNKRTEKQARNKTVELMKRAGRDDLAAAADAGVLTAKEAYATMLSDAAELRKAQSGGDLTAKMREYQLAVQQGYEGSFIDYQQQGGGKPPQVGSIPQGYELVTGTNEKGETTLRYVPIKGGPADTTKQEGAKREAQSTSGMVVLEDIGRALEIAQESPFLSTGFVGGILKGVGGTPAKDLASLTTTIQANIGFDRLQRMREESPTGGALGQVAVQELEALQATLGNLDNSQTNQQVVENLTRLEEQYRKSMQEIYRAALKDQAEGKINTKTGRVISPLDYFSESDIQRLSGAGSPAPSSGASPSAVTHVFNPNTGKVEPVR
jgi:hypothetical protein